MPFTNLIKFEIIMVKAIANVVFGIHSNLSSSVPFTFGLNPGVKRTFHFNFGMPFLFEAIEQ